MGDEVYEKKIKLLSHILTDDLENSNIINNTFNEIYYLINNKLPKALEMLEYSYSSKIIEDLNEVLNKIEILIKYPQLIGKTILTIMGSDKDTYKFISNNLIEDKNGLYLSNSNIPAIIYSGKKKGVQALNYFESNKELENDEYNLLVKELYKDNIDIRQFINILSFNEELIYKNTTIINLPDYVLGYNEYYKILKQLSNIVIFYCTKENNWQKKMKYINSDKHIILVLEEDYIKNVEEIIKDNFENNEIEICTSESEFEEVISRYNKIQINYYVEDLIMLALIDVDIFHLNYIEKEKNNIKNINKDILNINQENIKTSLNEIKKEIVAKVNKLDEEYFKYKDIQKEILDKSMILSEEFSKQIETLSKEEETFNSQNFIDNKVRLFFKLFYCKKYKEDEKCIEDLKKYKYRYTSILELILDSGKENEVNLSQVNKYDLIDDKDIGVIKFKIMFNEQLGISDEETALLVNKLKNIDTNKEYYYLGIYYEKKNIDKAIKMYFNSLELGYSKAQKKLYCLAKNTNKVSMELLSQYMVADANYEMGMKYLSNKYAKAITNFKMAATQNHIKSIRILVDEEYKKYRIVKKDTLDDNKKNNINKLILMYNHLLENGEKDFKIYNNIGVLYYNIGDYRRALEFLQKSEEHEALFLCGRMYQYGNGTTQDLYKAKEYFQKAKDKGNIRASKEYEKVCKWIEDNNVRKSNSYSSSSNYSSSYSSYSYKSSDSLCFITTATCYALNKGSQCDELNDLRAFRDNHIDDNGGEGTELIKEYYRIGPMIVEKINNEIDSTTIYEELWNEYIKPSYINIKEKNYDKAKLIYILMVKELCETFDIKVKESISQKYNINMEYGRIN